MNFGTVTVTEKTENEMDWNVNTTYKTYKVVTGVTLQQLAGTYLKGLIEKKILYEKKQEKIFIDVQFRTVRMLTGEVYDQAYQLSTKYGKVR
ncbi:hypothetical protein HS088_TW16G00526 [Tripterygium wilfordii]|uniref:Uncharacterized protein n=1 Tax=Tripterygium wilfordii TaxID=458696 RepID=A0A7J7CJ69_TRIWF|nr:hypothetical protein HS088_TW16G00526 [Tripterygium wilfordii]